MKFSLLESGIQLKECRIPLTVGTWILRCGIPNPRVSYIPLNGVKQNNSIHTSNVYDHIVCIGF